MFNAKKILIPFPQEFKDKKTEIKIGSLSDVHYNIIKDSIRSEIYDEAVKTIQKAMKKNCASYEETHSETAYKIKIKIDKDSDVLRQIGKSESYLIEITEEEAFLCAADDGGIFYAAVTFCNLIHCIGNDVFLPCVTIHDWPDFEFRSQLIECRYGSDFMTLDDWFGAIDNLAEMKYNHLTVALYGCWPIQYDGKLSEYLYISFDKFPQLKTPRSIKYYSPSKKGYIIEKDVLPTMFKEDFFGKLVAYGKKKNVKIIPLFNSLGHNSLISRTFPEVSAKDECGHDTGYGICTESAKTGNLMFELYDEIIDKYLKPNKIDSIHIGLDEVINAVGLDKTDIYKESEAFCRCDKCKKYERSELMLRYMIKMCKYLKKRGMKNIHIYFDMFFHEFDMLNDKFRERLKEEGLYDNIVIDWWSYRAPDDLFRGRKKDVNNLFRSIIKPMSGYFQWSVHTNKNVNIEDCVRLAVKLGFEGVEAYGSYDICYEKNYLYQAELCWNTSMIGKKEEFDERYAYRICPENFSDALSACNWVDAVTAHEIQENLVADALEYYTYTYIRNGKPYPRNYPGEVFEKIKSDEKKYLTYFDKTIALSEAASAFFEQYTGSEVIDAYYLTVQHYKTLCNEFYTLYRLYIEYAQRTANEFDVLSKVKYLIFEREKLMALAEKTKTRANSIQYLRNMSISRQYLCDLQYYFEREIQCGNRPVFDIFDSGYFSGEMYYFLR